MRKLLITFLLMIIDIIHILSAQNTTQELIINGDFSQNNCSENSCIYQTSNQLYGWIPEPDIQIGPGFFYNSNFGNEKTIELAPYINGCIRQTVTGLTPGIYQLKYFYAPRNGIVFDNCRFAVKFNAKQLREITPVDYNVNSDTVQIGIYSSSDADVRFCSTGILNDGTGAILASVSLVRSRDLPVQSEVFNPSRIVLDSHSEKAFEREYELENGPIQISFDYLLVATFLATESTVVVKFDGKEIYKVRTCQSGNNIKISVRTQVLKGVHNISFHTVGSSNEGPHKILISNVVVNQIQCIPSETGNIIVNGEFSDNKCSTVCCVWNQQTFENDITGWIPNPEIEVGTDVVYGLAQENSIWVSELDVNANSCMGQKVILKAGRHALKFDYAARNIVALNSSWIQVKLNGNLIDFIKPLDNDIHTETVNLQLSDTLPESLIELCGAGISDGAGPLVFNIQMFSYYRCLSTKIFSF